MLYYFATVERKQALVTEAESWRGTPFLLQGRQKGFGVDCVSLVAEIYLQTGAITAFDPPLYALDGGNHSDNPRLEDGIAATMRFDVIWHRPEEYGKAPVAIDDLLQVGDLLVFRLGRIAYHCAIYLGGSRIIQALAQPTGVSIGSTRDPVLSKRFQTVYRPMA